MEILLIESDSRRRVALAAHMCRSGHRVTLAASLAEAREIFKFVECAAECPAAVLIAEDLLDSRGAELRNDLADRFPDLAWVPVRADADLAWLGDWVEQSVSRQTRARRTSLRILLVEPDREIRREVCRRLTFLGDRVVPCASLSQAQKAIDRARPYDVLVAPVMAGRAEAISFFLSAKQRLPGLRWIVSAPGRADAVTSLRRTVAGFSR